MRTDRTFLCVSCRIRFTPALRCPVCGRDTTVFDVRERGARNRARDILVRRRLRRGGGAWIGVDSVRAHTSGWQRRLIVGALIMGFVFASPWLAVRVLRVHPYLLVFIGVGLAFAWVVARALRAAWAERHRTPMQLQISEPTPEAPPPESEKVRGRVRALRTFDSPVAGKPCVAARVVGDSFGGVVDHAHAVTFELLPDDPDDDEAYRVELGVATVDLAIRREPVEVAGNDRLDAFLARRGLFPALGRIVVAEGVLADGDRVEVEGVVRTGTREETYRHMGKVRYLREDEGVPLTIRGV